MTSVGADETTSSMFRTEMRGDVLLAVLDMPGRTMNVFSWALMDALEGLVERFETSGTVKALVLTSGKDSFLAGADLEMVRGFADLGRTAGRDKLREITGRLGRLFNRLEDVPKPSVAAVNGLAMGGGLEIAMACHYRIVADDPRLQLAVPEIKLGLLPGAGGTQRMPRLIGIERGLEFLLSGDTMTPADARAAGLVDAVVPGAQLVERAIALAQDMIAKPATARRLDLLDPGPFDLAAKDAVQHIISHFGYDDATIAHYPAYRAIVRATLGGAQLPVRDGTEHEIACFIDLMQDSVAGNMITVLFLGRQKADKLLMRTPMPKPARFVVSAGGKAADDLRAALLAAKATLITAAEAGDGDIVIGDPSCAGGLQLLATETDRISTGTGVHVRRSKQYGTAIEIVTAVSDGADTDTDKALALAQRLRATPYVHGGNRSLLALLGAVAKRAGAAGLPGDAAMLAQSLAAERLRSEDGVGDPAMADVACAVSGVFPAYAGGPFTFFAQSSADKIARLREHYRAAAPALFH